jgi:hypothetical protein
LLLHSVETGVFGLLLRPQGLFLTLQTLARSRLSPTVSFLESGFKKSDVSEKHHKAPHRIFTARVLAPTLRLVVKGLPGSDDYAWAKPRKVESQSGWGESTLERASEGQGGVSDGLPVGPSIP